jgi:hypothetical protein
MLRVMIFKDHVDTPSIIKRNFFNRVEEKI